jgi:hypothetical protein
MQSTVYFSKYQSSRAINQHLKEFQYIDYYNPLQQITNLVQRNSMALEGRLFGCSSGLI